VFGAFLALSCVLVITSLVFSEPDTEDYRVSQSGLLTFLLFTALLIPVRVRWWLAVKRELPSRRRIRWGTYLSSGRLFLDLSIALALLSFVFLLDLAFWPHHAVRLGVATAISLVGLGVGVLTKARTDARP